MQRIITAMNKDDWTTSFTSPEALELWMGREGYTFKIGDLNTIVAVDDKDDRDLHLHVSYTQLLSTEDMLEKIKEQAKPEPEIERNACPECFENMVRIGTNPEGEELWKCESCGYLAMIGGETDGVN